MRWTGTLVREDLGAGVWVLETDEGERLQLAGDVPRRLSGKRVVVEGSAGGGHGFGMLGGSTIDVSRVKRA